MRTLFVGGGTMGSVTPLLAVAEALRVRDAEIVLRWWGTSDGPERSVVIASGIPFQTIRSGKLRRYWSVWNVTDVVQVVIGCTVAFVRFLRWRPDVVVGAGGYVQVPALWAAGILRIPILIHQQDVRAGLANRLVAACADVITMTFPETNAAFGGRGVVVGNSVRPMVLAARGIAPHDARARFHIAPDRHTVLVLGGGTGSRRLNELVWAAQRILLESVNVIHVTGQGKGRGVEMPNAKCQMPNYRSFEFLTEDLPYAYAAADLVVARAGMGTTTELVALGKAAVLIPMPGTHQEENAAVIAAHGAVEVWDEQAMTPEVFSGRLRALIMSAPRRAELQRGIANVFPTTDVAEVIARYVRSIATPHVRQPN